MAGIEIWNWRLDFLWIEKSRSSFHNPKEMEFFQMSKKFFKMLVQKFCTRKNSVKNLPGAERIKSVSSCNGTPPEYPGAKCVGVANVGGRNDAWAFK